MLTVDTPGGASEQHREESVGASGEATWSDDEGEAGQVPARPEQPPEPPQPAKAPIANNAAGSEPPPADDGQAGQGEPGSGPGEPVTQMDIDEPAASSQGPAEDTEDSCAPDAESEAENGPSVTSFMVPSRLLNSAFLETVSDELPPDEDRDDSSYFATKLPPPVSILKPASWGIFLPVSFSTAMSLDAAKLEEWNVRSVIVADRALLSGRVLQDRFAELCGLGRTEGAERMTGWGSVKSSVVWSPRIAGFLKEKFEAWKLSQDATFLFPARDMGAIKGALNTRLPAPEAMPDCPHWEARLWRVQFASCLRWIKSRIDGALEPPLRPNTPANTSQPSIPSILIITPPRKLDNVAALVAASSMIRDGGARSMKHWFSMNGLPGFQASETFLEDFDVEVGTTLYRLQRAGALAPAPENPAALLKRSIAQSPTPLGNSSQWKGVPGAPDLLFVPWDPSMALPNVPKRAPEPGLIDPMGPQQDVAPVRTLIPEPTTASRNDELGLQGRAALTAPSAPHSLPPAPREARQVPVTAAQTNISGGAASSSEPTLGAMRRTLDGFLSDYAKRDLTQEQSRLSTELALSLSRTVDTAMALRATEFDAIRGAFEAERGRWEAEKEALLKLRKSTSDGFDRLKEERDALLGQVERLKKSASVEFGRLKEERDAAVNELERLKKSTSEGLDRLKEERDAAVGELERLKATHDHAQAHQTDSSSLPANVIDQIQSAVRQALAQGRSAHQDEPPAHADDNLADDEPRSKRRRTGATSASKAQEAPATRKRKGRPPAAVTPDDYTPPMAIDPVKQESLPKNDPPLPISHQLDTPAGPMQDSLRPSDGGAADVSAALEAAAAVHAPAAPILQLPAPQPPAPQGKRSKAKKQNNSAKSGHSVTAAGGMGSIEDELRQAGGNQSWYFPRGGQVEVRGGQMLYRSTPTTWAAGLGPMLAYPGPRPPSTHHLGLQSGLGSHQLAASGQQQSSGTIPSGDRTAVTASTFPYAESIQYYGRLTQDPKVTWKSMADQASSLVGSAMSYTQPRMRKDTTLSLTPTLQSQNKTFHGEDSATVSARRMQLISKGATLPASLPGNINSYYEAGRQAGGHAGGDSASQGHSEAVQQPQFIHYPPQNQ